jgi:hypothetical protein
MHAPVHMDRDMDPALQGKDLHMAIHARVHWSRLHPPLAKPTTQEDRHMSHVHTCMNHPNRQAAA